MTAGEATTLFGERHGVAGIGGWLETHFSELNTVGELRVGQLVTICSISDCVECPIVATK